MGQSAYVWTAVKQSGLLREKGTAIYSPLLKKSGGTNHRRI